ncbi:DNA-directed RNA polymerase III subunit RPC5 [Olea europaea subsp. europaea]|uniref:DNA-directed RNA polymerase III subunit RPC5 n=1 Tax=Olea europaea subsp. europaea TaxID=158383 RepID=A0A8S0UY10_OLEEU|nr:DNA-directed RNA polymerase III subunit RPC5 [Olea europaea subsp. europaea]
MKLMEHGSPNHGFDALKHLALDDSVEEVLEVLQEYARLVQGLWVPKSSLFNLIVNRWNLLGAMYASFQQICQRLKDLADSESARSRGFAKETFAAANSICAFPDELQAIISRFAFDIHGVYVPKSFPDHPQYDPFRKVVIDLLIAEGPKAKLKEVPIVEAAKMELQRDIPQIGYQKVLQELCVSQGSA